MWQEKGGRWTGGDQAGIHVPTYIGPKGIGDALCVYKEISLSLVLFTTGKRAREAIALLGRRDVAQDAVKPQELTQYKVYRSESGQGTPIWCVILRVNGIWLYSTRNILA